MERCISQSLNTWVYTPFLCSGKPTCLTLGVAVRRVVDWAGLVFCVSIEDMIQGGAAGSGRHLTIQAIGGWAGAWPGVQIYTIHWAGGRRGMSVLHRGDQKNMGLFSSSPHLLAALEGEESPFSWKVSPFCCTSEKGWTSRKSYRPAEVITLSTFKTLHDWFGFVYSSSLSITRFYSQAVGEKKWNNGCMEAFVCTPAQQCSRSSNAHACIGLIPWWNQTGIRSGFHMETCIY